MTKTAIITGSTKGIGKDVAYALANNGYNVTINSRHQKDADLVARDISKNFDVNTLGIAADITKFNQVNSMIKKTLEKFGQIDVLVNNAGILVVK
ncbi:MAG: SDR family NAD(P)-dependent oxidoreductase, partial [Nitrosopumilaceae archaeon]|nr:SDR family NAD(P)-dependent oxidoreductase [Nitrosopumilaceae archaeon]